jgi:uncharacterized membrane protein YfcA
MIHTFIGLIVGLIMGLTGAGGALISIPLFLLLLNASLKEATVLSLIAVILGTAVNLFGQKHKVDKKIVIYFVVFGAIASYTSLPLKAFIPDYIIAVLLSMIASVSIWSIWRKGIIEKASLSKPNFVKLAMTGLLLGLITSLTGLGGGVLLVPILITVFGESYETAMPTSLATIFFISLITFFLQIKIGLALITFPEIGLIAVGALTAFYLLKFFLSRFDTQKIVIVRKVVFTLVTLYSLVSVMLKSI